MMTKIGSVAKVLGIGAVGAFIGVVAAGMTIVSEPTYAAILSEWADILEARTKGTNLSITIDRKDPIKNEEEES